MLSLGLRARGARNGSRTLQVVLGTCFGGPGTESGNRRPSGGLILLVNYHLLSKNPFEECVDTYFDTL